MKIRVLGRFSLFWQALEGTGVGEMQNCVENMLHFDAFVAFCSTVSAAVGKIDDFLPIACDGGGALLCADEIVCNPAFYR